MILVMAVLAPSFIRRLHSLLDLIAVFTSASLKMKKLKSKGWGPWKYEWYSICSAHFVAKQSCNNCNRGNWVNVYEHAVISYICKVNYPLWYWWVNNSKYPKLMVLIRYFLYGKMGFKKTFGKS